MSSIKRLSPPQSRKVNSLVRRECCNCDNGHCILLDDGDECVCPQLISYSLLCKWFRIAVLPLDKLLRRVLCVKVKQRQILPGLPQAYHEQAGSGAHEETARPCYAIRAKIALIYRACSA